MSAAAVVLAAGQGTRFKSDTAKVLHRLTGRTMLRWVLEALRPMALDRVVVVVGHQGDVVRREAEAAGLRGLVTVVQSEQRGTGHAVRHALQGGMLDDCDTVLVTPGDVPLLHPRPLDELLLAHGDGGVATLLTTRLNEPAGYGRVVRDAGGNVTRVVEHNDATDAERQIDEVATSIYAFDRSWLGEQLRHLSTDNARGEEYLTDVVAAATGQVTALLAPAEFVSGVNDRVELAAAAGVLRRRILEHLMRDGVTVEDPPATYVEAEVAVGRDTVLLAGTRLEGRTSVGRGAIIGPATRLVDAVVEDDASVSYSVVVDASVGPGATVGPYTYLRPGTRLEDGAKAGAFVEMKKARIGLGSKVPHLSYLGDATVGADVNVGAGTITCNYDGYDKHETVIEDGAFIGSDTMLIAPVRIGARAVTAAGSAITKDVPDDALGVERADQRTVDGYVRRRRARRERKEG
jgi:bifunctional UDP-N-acetylglucosamine pyrophosphorylase / glucosamine-1-phosphate N-acetyltransferase